MLNGRQKYLLDVMERLRYLRKDQLFSFSRLRFGTGETLFRQDIRQLCYLNRLMETEVFVLLPGQAAVSWPFSSPARRGRSAPSRSIRYPEDGRPWCLPKRTPTRGASTPSSFR